MQNLSLGSIVPPFPLQLSACGKIRLGLKETKFSQTPPSILNLSI